MGGTVYAVYETTRSARGAVEALLDVGFPERDVSVIAPRGEPPRRGEQGTGLDDEPPIEGTTPGVSTQAGPPRGFAREGGWHDRQPPGIDASAGAAAGGILGVLAGATVFAVPGAVLLGPIAAGLAGIWAGGAAGGLVEALVRGGVTEEQARSYAGEVKDGRTVVLVQAEGERAGRAREVLSRFGPVDVEAGATG